MLPLRWFRIPDILIKRGTNRHIIFGIRAYLQYSVGVVASARGVGGINAAVEHENLVITWTGSLPKNAYVVLVATRGTEINETIVRVEDYTSVLIANPPPDLVQQTVLVDPPIPFTRSVVEPDQTPFTRSVVEPDETPFTRSVVEP
ncbi:hypothetical protein F4X90_08865, partial [Candidatus Poribacteria bacterium]|nr:hypothetical protein [Candidatus Poribacteria bacterium]